MSNHHSKDAKERDPMIKYLNSLYLFSHKADPNNEIKNKYSADLGEKYEFKS